MSQQKKRKLFVSRKKNYLLPSQETESNQLQNEIKEGSLMRIKEEPAYFDYEELKVDDSENLLFGDSHKAIGGDVLKEKRQRQIRLTKSKKGFITKPKDSKDVQHTDSSPKTLQTILNKQRAALKYLQMVLTRFQNVTEDLQEFIELGLLDEQLETLNLLQSQTNQNFQTKIKSSQPRKRRKYLESPPKSPINENNLSENANLGNSRLSSHDITLNTDSQETPVLSRRPTSEKFIFVKQIVEVNGKGAFTSKKILKEERVAEFSGELYEKHAASSVYDSSFFEFDFHGLIMCMDASRNTCLGKHIRNDATNPNCKIEIEIVDDVPRLFFYAVKDIEINQELACNYQEGRCKRINFNSKVNNLDKHANCIENPIHFPNECSLEKSAVRNELSDDLKDHFINTEETDFEKYPLHITPRFLPEVVITSPTSSIDNLSEMEEKNIVVRQCSKTVMNKRVYDKKQACLFCGKLDFKISRHWNIAHSTHSVIRKLNSLAPGRTKLNFQSILRLQGNYNHNIKVLESGSGELLIVRRSTEKCDVTDYLPCPHCFGFFNTKEMTRHMSSCIHRNWNHQEFMQMLEDQGLLLHSQVFINSMNIVN